MLQDNDKEKEDDLYKFKVTKIVPIGTWNRALNMARLTAGKAPLEKEPSAKWKRKMLLAQHSPIREVVYDIFWSNIKMRISVHFVRHHEGIEKFVHTQRDDRNPNIKNSDELPQGALNDMAISVNAQEIMAISNARLCHQAGKDSQYVWKKTLEALKEYDPELVSKCVPTCVMKGFCPELKSCGYCNSKEYYKQLKEYRKTE